MDVDELLDRAMHLYELALDILDGGDYVDACEKAWACVEMLRKALLVKAGMSYSRAKTITYGIPLFTRLLKKLGRKELLEKYTFFDYKLHIMGFYEGITEPWEIEEIIRNDLKVWMDSMRDLIGRLNINIASAEEILVEIEKIKRKLIIENAKLVELRGKLDAVIEDAVSV